MASPLEIVVLGGNFGGLQAVHYLLRQSVPALSKLGGTSSRKLHVTLVTPNTHFYFKIGSPRALVQPKLLAPEKLWRPLTEAFQRYPAEQFTLLQARATGLDPAARKVKIAKRPAQSITGGKAAAAGTTTAEWEETEIAYDALIISTGTTSPSPLWTIHNEEAATHAAFEATQLALSASSKGLSVFIAGGGPVGVETAGEIKTLLPDAHVELYSGADKLVARAPKPTVGQKTQDYLEQKMGVKVIHNVKTIDAKKEGTKYTVTLSDGSKKTVDLYIDATGGKANSAFLPTEWLDKTGRVVTKDEYFRVRGGPSGGTSSPAFTYALGDIVAGSNNTIFDLDAMIPTVCSALTVDIAAQINPEHRPSKPGLLSSLFGSLFGSGSPAIYLKEFKPIKDTMILPLGLQGGVSILFGWMTPNFFTKMAKGKSYLIETVDLIITGDKWKA